MSITISATVDGGPEVNMANGNAAQVFDLLGITGDTADILGVEMTTFDSGHLPAADFCGRVLPAQAPSTPPPATTRAAPTSGTATGPPADGAQATSPGGSPNCGRSPPGHTSTTRP